MSFASIDLEEYRTKNPSKSPIPHPHQSEAFSSLAKAFLSKSNIPRAGLLVLPTGGGKTFTAVSWLCRNVLSKGYKVLWLANSSYLLDQAKGTFERCLGEVLPPRKHLNIRVVSSSPAHSPVSSIEPTDDIAIVTTQTAITQYGIQPLDEEGRQAQTFFRKFIGANIQNLFIVLDEAHHAPAFGCRHLLLALKGTNPAIPILGLTATPTYGNKNKSGWLSKIFNLGIVYDVSQAKLTAQGILSAPKYIKMPTGRDIEVDDSLYNRLVREHKDLPEEIVDLLARDSARNDYIVGEYVKNQDTYGKTIIFADKWFQCVYLVQKLQDKGIRADAVFNKMERDPDAGSEWQRRTPKDNDIVMEKFRNGKIDVVVNIRMLTEGVDVPDVQTVFITRETNSTILFTQMVGRSLRGEKAGGGLGKKEANIVLFMDNWKRLLNWVKELPDRGISDTPVVRGSYPVEYISLALIERLSKEIDSQYQDITIPFIETIPVGWYQVEYTVAIADEDSERLESYTEFVMVYNRNQKAFQSFLSSVTEILPDKWASESLDNEWMKENAQGWLAKHFTDDQTMGDGMWMDLARLARHLAQNGNPPEFHIFEERDNYDVDELASKMLDLTPREQSSLLLTEFNKAGSLWKAFYTHYDFFKRAVDHSVNRILNKEMDCSDSHSNVDESVKISSPNPPVDPVNPEEVRKIVFRRDGWKCLCCGKQGRGSKLQLDDIHPKALRGANEIDNLQTLCSVCNRAKGVNHMNFRDVRTTPLTKPKSWENVMASKTESAEQALRRAINFFYHCSAVANIRLHQRKNGQYYTHWIVELNPDNPPSWLEVNKDEILQYLQNDLEMEQVVDISFRSVI